METPDQDVPEDDIESNDADFSFVSEEVIFDEFDVGAGKKLPLTLRTYENGVQKLHWGISENFGQQLEKIKVLLEERGLELDSLNLGQFYRSGMFLIVQPKGMLAEQLDEQERLEEASTDDRVALMADAFAALRDIQDQDDPARTMRNPKVIEEVILNEYDNELRRYVPVTLRTHDKTGGQELYRDYSAQFDEHVKKAAAILRARGLEVSPPGFSSNLGAFMSVGPKGTGTGTVRQRLFVMDGESHLQVWQAGAWKDSQVKQAGNLGPGIYNLYLAQSAAENRVHDGMIVHVDKDAVYQQHGGSFTSHDIGKFDKVPVAGEFKSISYEWGRAVLAPGVVTRGRGMH
ncbi:MAG: KfrB domain-containing protein [Pseudomonadota bacterium]